LKEPFTVTGLALRSEEIENMIKSVRYNIGNLPENRESVYMEVLKRYAGDILHKLKVIVGDAMRSVLTPEK